MLLFTTHTCVRVRVRACMCVLVSVDLLAICDNLSLLKGSITDQLRQIAAAVTAVRCNEESLPKSNIQDIEPGQTEPPTTTRVEERVTVDMLQDVCEHVDLATVSRICKELGISILSCQNLVWIRHAAIFHEQVLLHETLSLL